MSIEHGEWSGIISVCAFEPGKIVTELFRSIPDKYAIETQSSIRQRSTRDRVL